MLREKIRICQNSLPKQTNERTSVCCGGETKNRNICVKEKKSTTNSHYIWKALLWHPFLSRLKIFFPSHSSLLVEDLLAAQWGRIGFRPFCFSYRYCRDPLSIICLQLRDGVLAVFISLPGIIAVMIGFAENMNTHVNETVKCAKLQNVFLFCFFYSCRFYTWSDTINS